MKLHKEARNLSREIFRASFTDGKLDQAKMQQIAKAIADSKPRFYMEVLKEYLRLARLELSKRHAVVESAIQLDALAKYEIERDLQKKYGTELTTEFTVNPELIGGLRIRIGSDVWDGSIKARLQALEKEIAA